MKFSRQQKKEAYQKLPVEVQNFIMDNDTSELIERYLTENGLIGEISDAVDSEILYAMYGLQTLSDMIVNIAKLNNKDENNFTKLRADLEDNIFSKIKNINSQNTNNFNRENQKSEYANSKKIKDTEIIQKLQEALKDKQKEVPEYVKNLPQEVQKFVFNDLWKNRVDEISQKYSLGPGQSAKLKEIVLSIIIKLDSKDILQNAFVTELSISELLARQISNDVDARVFDYLNRLIMFEDAVDVMDKKENVATKTPTTTIEIPPQILPAIEPGETAHTTPKTVSPTISVPRYVPEPVIPQPKPQFPSQSPIQNQPPKPQPEPQKTQQNPQFKPSTPPSSPHNLPGIEIVDEQKYKGDPYREPLE